MYTSDYGHSMGDEVIFHLIVGLVCFSLINNNDEHLFVFIGHCVFILRNACSDLLPAFDWVVFLLLSYESTSYIVHKSPLSVMICLDFFPILWVVF